MLVHLLKGGVVGIGSMLVGDAVSGMAAVKAMSGWKQKAAIYGAAGGTGVLLIGLLFRKGKSPVAEKVAG